MNPVTWIDDSFSLRLVQTLLHFLWQGAAVASLAFALDLLLKGRLGSGEVSPPRSSAGGHGGLRHRDRHLRELVGAAGLTGV